MEGTQRAPSEARNYVIDLAAVSPTTRRLIERGRVRERGREPSFCHQRSTGQPTMIPHAAPAHPRAMERTCRTDEHGTLPDIVLKINVSVDAA